jgi:HSP20 family protein
MEHWEPFRSLSDVQTEMNRLFDNIFTRPMSGAGRGDRFWAPFVDMHEAKDELVLLVDLPGVSEKDVSLSITGDLVSIKGERAARGKEANALHVERVYGRFERLIQLPLPVQADRAQASYRDGVLEIRLPKVEAIKPKEIKIDVR